jgi:hypothetical protein
MKDSEYIIFCDESDKKGPFYSNFYGGVLVGISSYQKITARLEHKKRSLGFGKEIKWQRVSDQYLEKYKSLMEAFFSEISANRLKVRIMFRQNTHVRKRNSDKDDDLEYFKLYYQFIKHGFGLSYIDHQHPEVHLRLYFDQFPDTSERAVQFKGFLMGLQEVATFKNAKLKIRDGDITEVMSHDHILLQCLDVVLGAMSFRLNNRHKEKPPGQYRRGKRTVAKEQLYKYILSEIRNLYPGFNTGISTGKAKGMESLWLDRYRHWQFLPKEFVYDDTQTKSAKKNKPHRT